MSDVEVFGGIKRRCEDTITEWEIPNFFSIVESKSAFESPTFPFADTFWRLRLRSKSVVNPSSGYIRLLLVKLENKDCCMDYSFGLKQADNSIEHLTKGFFNSRCAYSDAFLIPLSDLRERRSELARSDVLTFTCTLKYTASNPKRKVKDHPEFRKLIKLSTLSTDFKSLFSDEDSSDTTLNVMDKEYKAHRAILMARSSVFSSMFLHETSEKQTGIVNITDCDPKSFGKFLKFLYCGKLNITVKNAPHLYATSHKYDVQELNSFCREFLMQNLSARNFCDIVTLADKYDDVTLSKAAQDYFNDNMNEILKTSEWDSFVENYYSLSKELLAKMASSVEVVHQVPVPNQTCLIIGSH